MNCRHVKKIATFKKNLFTTLFDFIKNSNNLGMGIVHTAENTFGV